MIENCVPGICLVNVLCKHFTQASPEDDESRILSDNRAAAEICGGDRAPEKRSLDLAKNLRVDHGSGLAAGKHCNISKAVRMHARHSG